MRPERRSGCGRPNSPFIEPEREIFPALVLSIFLLNFFASVSLVLPFIPSERLQSCLLSFEVHFLKLFPIIFRESIIRQRRSDSHTPRCSYSNTGQYSSQ